MNTLSAFESILVRSAASLASARGEQASLVVLIFHRVNRERDPLLPSEPDIKLFSAQMRLLAQNFHALRLSDALDKLYSGTLPNRAVSVTFDDGYANNCEIALPILQANNIPATVFVAPGFLNGGRMFNDTIIEAIRRAPTEFDLSSEQLGTFQLTNATARMQAVERIITSLKHLDPRQRWNAAERIAERCGAALPTNLMMTDEQVKTLHRAGIEIGAHTMTHPILASIDDNTARREIEASKTYLEALLGTSVSAFAYPNGKPVRDYAASHVQLVKDCKFSFALSTSWGAATKRSDRFQIPRLAPWDATALRYAARMIRGYRERNATTV